jgi:hypothetical protein
MTSNDVSEAAKGVVRRNTEEVQSKGNFELFEDAPTGREIPFEDGRRDAGAQRPDRRALGRGQPAVPCSSNPAPCP